MMQSLAMPEYTERTAMDFARLRNDTELVGELRKQLELVEFETPEGVEVPEQFLCPISRDLLKYPVVIATDQVQQISDVRTRPCGRCEQMHAACALEALRRGRFARHLRVRGTARMRVRMSQNEKMRRRRACVALVCAAHGTPGEP